MKISHEIYCILKHDIAAIVAANKIDLETANGGKTGLMTMYNLLYRACNDRSYNDEHPNFKSGYWKRILPYNGRDYCFYYDNDCNDSHLNTVLRKIKQELIESVKGLNEIQLNALANYAKSEIPSM